MSEGLFYHGVDSLDIRVSKNFLPSQLLQDLAVAAVEYIRVWEPGAENLFFELPGLGTFRVLRSQFRVYAFKLVNVNIGDIYIWNPERWFQSRKSKTGQFYVSFRSSFLLSGQYNVVREFLDTLYGLFYSSVLDVESPYCVFERISRVDLCADVARDAVTWADLDQFVSRSRVVDAFVSPLSDQLHKQWTEHVQQLKKHKSSSQGNKVPANPHMTGAGVDPVAGSGAVPGPAAGASSVLSSDLLAQIRESIFSDLADIQSSRLSRVVAHSRTPKTLYFGRFGSQLYGRVYDKVLACFVQDKLYMLDVWQNFGWTGEPVWRVEFSMSAEFLRDFNVSLIQDSMDNEKMEVIKNINDDLKTIDLSDLATFDMYQGYIWRYLTGHWLRHTVGSDSNLERRPLSDWWRAVLSAYKHDDIGFRRRRYHPNKNNNVKSTLQKSRGFLISAASKLAPGDDARALNTGIRNAVSLLQGLLQDDPHLLDDVLDRRRRDALDVFSDECFSAMIRSERLHDGKGS